MTNTKGLPQRSNAVKRDWTRGPIVSNLLLLSWPMLVMEGLYMISQIVDLIWVGRLGSSSIAGVGIAGIFIMLVSSVDMGLNLGSRAMIARYVGAGDIERANNVAGQSIFMGTAWGVIMTVAGILLAEPVLRLFDVESSVVAEGTAYLRVIFAGWVSMQVLVTGLFAIQSSGDTVKPMTVEIVIRVVHLTLCPFLVLGLWVFPRLGVSGAALSNVISNSLGAVIVISLLFSKYTRLRLKLSDFRPVPEIIWRMLKIGIPAFIMKLQKALGDLILTWIISPFGTLAIASHSLASRVESFLFSICLGIGGGAGVLVGQNLGAGQSERAEKSGWVAVGVVEGIMVACSISILVWAENIVGIFTDETGLVEIGSIFLRIATAGYILGAIVQVLQYCITGAGDTVPTMVASIAMIWVIQLPLAYLLPEFTDLGVYGIRWALVAGTLAGAVMYTTYFKMGRWKVKKI